MVDDRPRSTDRSGGTSRGNRGNDNVGSTEPHRLTDSQLALLRGDDGGSDSNDDHQSIDTDLPAPGTEPSVWEGGSDSQTNIAQVQGDSSGVVPGVTAPSVGPNLSAVLPGVTVASAEDVGLEQHAIDVMRDASLRFDSMSALLQMAQGI
jgi:hypothetical protein